MPDHPHRPDRDAGLSVRVQLTLSYAAFLVLVWVALFTVGLLLLRFVPEANLTTDTGGWAPNRPDLLAVFVRYAVWVLLALTALGLAGGWLLAGRMLKPLTRITEAARLVRDGSLGHRIQLPGHRNELTYLADTFDQMLDRVQHSVEEHRRFAANASHELRTPHSVIRTMLEVAQSTTQSPEVERLLRRIEETNERSILLTEALLDLADADRHHHPLTALNFDELVSGVVNDVVEDATQAQLTISTQLDSRYVLGDRTLLRQLVSNLLRNAIVHNVPNGHIYLSTVNSTDNESTLEITNTGPMIDPIALPTFTEPFTRGSGRSRRAGQTPGSGLGLAIVSSIARLHQATLHLTANKNGGMTVRVIFPPASEN